MTNYNLKQYKGVDVKTNSYMIIRVGKTINIYLSSYNLDDLLQHVDKDKGMIVVEYFQLEDGREYVILPKDTLFNKEILDKDEIIRIA